MVVPSTSLSQAYAASPPHHSVALATEQLVAKPDFYATIMSTAVKAASATKKTFGSSTAPQSSSICDPLQSFINPLNLAETSSSPFKWLARSPSSSSPDDENLQNNPSRFNSSTSTSSCHEKGVVNCSNDDDDSNNTQSSSHPMITEVDEVFDWESRKLDTPFWLHATAGSCAGIVEHSIMYPVDTVKTRIQALATHRTARIPTRQIFRELFSESGFRGFFRGLPAICFGCVPAHAALFTVYEFSKSEFTTSNALSSALCGGLATVSHDLILTPTDVVKQRLQLGCYNGVMDCVRMTFQVEGWKAFYRSIPTTLFMNVPFGAILVTTNEGLKRWLGLEKIMKRGARRIPINSSSVDDSSSEIVSSSLLGSYFLSGGIAGGIAGALTTPLDVIKTRLQTQNIRSNIYWQRSATLSGVQMNSTKQHWGPTYVSNNGNRFSNLLQRRTWMDKANTIKATPSFKIQPPRYSSFISTVKLIFVEEGVRGFWKGTSARLALSVPSTAICWGTYESVKYLISHNLLTD